MAYEMKQRLAIDEQLIIDGRVIMNGRRRGCIAPNCRA